MKNNSLGNWIVFGVVLLVIALIVFLGIVCVSMTVKAINPIGYAEKFPTVTHAPTQIVTPAPTSPIVQKTMDDIEFEKILNSDKNMYLPALQKSDKSRFEPIMAKEIEKKISTYNLNNSRKVTNLKDLDVYQNYQSTLTSAESDAMAAIRFYARSAEYAAQGNYRTCNDRLKEAKAKKSSAESLFNSIIVT